MRAVGIKVLKNKLSEYIRIAESGETVLITDRDRIVAELVPPTQSRSPSVADAVLADLVRKGLATPPLYAPGPLPPRTGPTLPTERLLQDLAADRSDR